MYTIAGSWLAARCGLNSRIETLPDGPPGTALPEISTSGISISPDWTSSSALRPSVGPSSNKNGGLAVASANASAAGSKTTWGVTAEGDDIEDSSRWEIRADSAG